LFTSLNSYAERNHDKRGALAWGFRLPWLLIVVVPVLMGVSVNAQLAGRVVGVTDRDTVTVLEAGNRQQKVRLAGIDAPEARQDFNQKAKRKLSDLVFGKTVRIEGTKIDRYGRRVAKILMDGKDVNLAMVGAGLDCILDNAWGS